MRKAEGVEGEEQREGRGGEGRGGPLGVSVPTCGHYEQRLKYQSCLMFRSNMSFQEAVIKQINLHAGIQENKKVI